MDEASKRDESEGSKPAQPAKKPYEAPKLTIYGDVAKLTRHKSKGKKHDGGSGSHSHTA